MGACEYVVVSDRTGEVTSRHGSREEATASVEGRGYEHHSGWTYRNPRTRDYVHVAKRSQMDADMMVVSTADALGLSADAYLQMEA